MDQITSKTLSDLVSRTASIFLRRSTPLTSKADLSSVKRELPIPAQTPEQSPKLTANDDQSSKTASEADLVSTEHTVRWAIRMAATFPAIIASPQLFHEWPGRTRMTLPDRVPPSRPCWEPPRLSYWAAEALVEIHDTITRREGRGDIAWRTQALDLGLETLLLHDYLAWADESRDVAREEGKWDEAYFFHRLREEVETDAFELVMENLAFKEVNGGRGVDEYSEMMCEVKYVMEDFVV